MALSKPKKVCITQQYLLCGTHECEKYFLFFCNQCHKPMCEPCRDKHLEGFQTKNHIVVYYNQRKHQLPVEKCRIHPSKVLDIHCKECNVHLCSTCCTLHFHRGHTFIDLETIYSDNWEMCQRKILQVRQYFCPTAEELQHKMNNNLDRNKEFLDALKAQIKSDAESFKYLVDMVASKRLDEIKKLETSFTDSRDRQQKSLSDYISYLDELVEKFSGCLFLSEFQSNPLIFSSSEELEIEPIPETKNSVVPYLFEPGKFTEYDVEKLLGKLTEHKIKPTKTKIEPMDTESALSKSFSIAKVREYIISAVTNACHVSLNMSGTLWVSEVDGIIVQTDEKGNKLQEIEINGLFGCHTVTKDEHLIYADTKNKVIKKRSHENQTVIFKETGDWEPLSVHSSKINGNILVGMVKKKPAIFFWMTRKFEAKICIYSRLSKEEIQQIQIDSNGQDLFDCPHYITENINGDICTSDSNKNALVVVTASGQHKFSYPGQGSDFTPRGVCTDNLGQILVCDHLNGTVHLLHKNGQFLALLRTEQHEKDYAFSVSVDDKNNLYVGKSDNIVVVYKYMQ